MVRVKLTSRDLKHHERNELLKECALFPALGRERISSIGICKPKKSINVDIQSRNDLTQSRFEHLPRFQFNDVERFLSIGELLSAYPAGRGKAMLQCDH
jgi:hypothetical protein